MAGGLHLKFSAMTVKSRFAGAPWDEKEKAPGIPEAFVVRLGVEPRLF